MLFACASYAQDIVQFIIQPTGKFLTSDGKDYVVVPFEGKTASDLFYMVKGNAMSFYNNPKEVISESGESVITIYAFDKNICTVKSLGATGVYGGGYHIVFKFKDGKIRVDAPSINEKLEMSGGAFTKTIGIPDCVYISDYAKKVCKGNSKKDLEKKSDLENVVNIPINHLLGFSKSPQAKKDDEDW